MAGGQRNYRRGGSLGYKADALARLLSRPPTSISISLAYENDDEAEEAACVTRRNPFLFIASLLWA